MQETQHVASTLLTELKANDFVEAFLIHSGQIGGHDGMHNYCPAPLHLCHLADTIIQSDFRM